MDLLIFEDEAPAAERLIRLIEGIAPEVQVLAVLLTVSEGIEHLRSGKQPDLILSDIELADGLCFEIFSQVKTTIPVVFTTAYNHYAIRAFEANAIDYLLKPVKEADLRRALERAKSRLPFEREEIDYHKLARIIEERQEAKGKRYLVRYGNKMFVVDTREAAYFYSLQKSTFMVNREGTSFPLDESLSQVEEDLADGDFFRINRNFLVHLKSIREMVSFGKSRIKLKVDPPHGDEEMLLVSTERSPEFRKWLKG